MVAGRAELVAGRALPELSDQPTGLGEATRLVELRRGGEEDLADARMALGQHASLVGDLEQAVAAEPLRERRWAQLMLALYRCGRQADALRAYQRLRGQLADQLGIEPSPELRALEENILLQKPELDGEQSAGPTDQDASSQPSGPHPARRHQRRITVFGWRSHAVGSYSPLGQRSQRIGAQM